jgi:hypothetical protein
MTSREMVYDFKMKWNKVDSQENANFRIPEIDWLLNEAAELIVKLISQPRRYRGLGFETSQRSIDDISTIVVPDISIPVSNGVVDLPNDYWHFVRAYGIADKGKCRDVKLRAKVRQHDDLFEENMFTRSSFEWRTFNVTFSEGSLKVHTDGSFVVESVLLTYIRNMSYIHNAQDTPGGSYTDLNGNILVGNQNCELPQHLHREIVDLAVLIASGVIPSPAYQLHQAKMSFHELTN